MEQHKAAAYRHVETCEACGRLLAGPGVAFCDVGEQLLQTSVQAIRAVMQAEFPEEGTATGEVWLSIDLL
jgi:hypothetical protein